MSSFISFISILSEYKSFASLGRFGYMCVQSLSRVKLCATHGLWPARLFCPWNFPGKNAGVGCHFLLQGRFLTLRLKEALAPALTGRFFTTVPLGKPLGTFITKYFILFVAVVSGTASLTSLSDILLLVYRNARDFWVLILCSETLPSSLINASSFLVAAYDFLCIASCCLQAVTVLLLLFQFGVF